MSFLVSSCATTTTTMTGNRTSGSFLGYTFVPVEEAYPYDICTSCIQTFDLTKEELANLKRSTKENMVLINCTLYEECGFEVPNAELCLPNFAKN